MTLFANSANDIYSLGKSELESALRLALLDPIKNALIVANLTQLKQDCCFAVESAHGEVQAVASFYMDLPFNSIALLAQDVGQVGRLVDKLAGHQSRLFHQPIFGLYDKATAKLVEENYRVTARTQEVKMVLEQDSIPEIGIDSSRFKFERLTVGDLMQISHLFSLVPAMAWTPRALTFGPYYGAYHDDSLVSIAGVHFATPWMAEIGNVVTHFNYRKQGLAYQCTKLVAEALQAVSEQIFLCVFADNTPAIRLYEKMGFVKDDDLYLLQYYLK